MLEVDNHLMTPASLAALLGRDQQLWKTACLNCVATCDLYVWRIPSLTEASIQNEEHSRSRPHEEDPILSTEFFANLSDGKTMLVFSQGEVADAAF